MFPQALGVRLCCAKSSFSPGVSSGPRPGVKGWMGAEVLTAAWGPDNMVVLQPFPRQTGCPGH